MSDTKEVLYEKLAAVLRDLMVEEDGKLVRAIPLEHAKQMTARELMSLFEWDHGIHKAIGGPDKHWNYTARLIPEHRIKTRKKDIPQIAKTKRIEKDHAEFQRKILAKSGVASDVSETQTKPRSAWPKGRKLQSRGFPKKQSARPARPA